MRGRLRCWWDEIGRFLVLGWLAIAAVIAGGVAAVGWLRGMP